MRNEWCYASFETHKFGHLVFRPSVHLPYKTSASCFACSIPSTSSPGSCSASSVHTSSAGRREDWRRRWLLRWGLFWARTSFGFWGVTPCDSDRSPDSLGSLRTHQLCPTRSGLWPQTYFRTLVMISFRSWYSPMGSSLSKVSQARASRVTTSRLLWFPVCA